PAEKVRCVVAVATPAYAKQEHAGCATLTFQRRIAIGIPLDDVFSAGILRAENEIKNDLIVFWILEGGEIDGWVGRPASVEHAYLSSPRTIDVESPARCFDQHHPLETFARLAKWQIFLLVIMRLRMRTPRQPIAFTAELDGVGKGKTIDRRTVRACDVDM